MRALVFNIVFIINTAFLMIFGVLFLPFSYKVMGNIVKFWGVCTRFWLKVICGIGYEIRGLENLPKDKAVIFASQHQSAWETAGLFHILALYVVYVMKADLQKIPLWKQLQNKAGSLSVRREDGAKAIKVMAKEARVFVEQGRSIIIFPEGTRVAAGQRRKFQSGVYALAKEFPDMPVIPVALNSGLYWPKIGQKIRKGNIVLELLPEMRIENFETKNDFLEELANNIYTTSQKLT